jgi:acyl carrier protein
MTSEEQILEMLRDYAGGEALTPDTRLDSLALDSLEFLDILQQVEDRFSFTIDKQVVPHINTIRDLCQLALSADGQFHPVYESRLSS